MKGYRLSIHVYARQRHLLEDLLITLESVNESLDQLRLIEIDAIQTSGSFCLLNAGEKNEAEPSTLQRNLFLDKWTFS